MPLALNMMAVSSVVKPDPAILFFANAKGNAPLARLGYDGVSEPQDKQMDEARECRLVAWVAEQVMPHEIAVRAWLGRRVVSKDDVDDLVQEAYCRIASTERFEQIERPDAYFFQIARNLLNDQLRRSNVVRIDSMESLEGVAGSEPAPDPETHAADRRELGRVAAILDALPERCRRIFELRRIEGLPQRVIAERMGVTESVVENEGARGLRLILQALRDQGGAIIEEYEQRIARRRRP